MEDETKGAPEEQADGAEVDDLAGALGDAWDEVAGDDAEAEAENPDDKPKEEVAEETVEEPVEETAEAEGEKEEVKALDDEEETTEAGEGVEITAAPEHWPAADKERFESLGDDHKAWFLDIRKSLETGYQSKFEEVAEYRKERQALDGLFQPHDEELALQGTDRVGAIRQLLAAHRSLQSRPGETIAWLAQQYGVDLSQATGQEGEVEYQDPAAAHKLQTLEAQLSHMQGHLQNQAQAAMTERQRSTNETIDTFRNEVANGALIHPHFDAVRVAMGSLIQSGAAPDLNTAYDMAVWADPTLRADALAKQSDTAARDKGKQRKESVEKAKRASRRVVSRPATAPAPKRSGKLRDDLSDAWDEHASA